MESILISIPKIYCINLKQAIDRRERMIRRFQYHNLFCSDEQFGGTEFINAIDKNSSLVQYYLDNNNVSEKIKAETACFASHLKTIRIFLESREKNAIICEDDILLKLDFRNELIRILSNLPDNTSLLSLCYIVDYWGGFKWDGKDKNYKNLCKIQYDQTWGTQMYLISSDYAKICLERYDQKFSKFTGFKTSELIVRFSQGYISYPPLAIEESLDSYIQDENEIERHKRYFSSWGYDNYY